MLTFVYSLNDVYDIYVIKMLYDKLTAQLCENVCNCGALAHNLRCVVGKIVRHPLNLVLDCLELIIGGLSEGGHGNHSII